MTDYIRGVLDGRDLIAEKVFDIYNDAFRRFISVAGVLGYNYASKHMRGDSTDIYICDEKIVFYIHENGTRFRAEFPMEFMHNPFDDIGLMKWAMDYRIKKLEARANNSEVLGQVMHARKLRREMDALQDKRKRL